MTPLPHQGPEIPALRGQFAAKHTCCMAGPAGEVVRDVARRYRLSVDELVGPCRKYRVSHPRQEAMFLLYETDRYSLPAIGRLLGGRDHTTVLHGVRRYVDRTIAEAEIALAQYRQRMERL